MESDGDGSIDTYYTQAQICACGQTQSNKTEIGCELFNNVRRLLLGVLVLFRPVDHRGTSRATLFCLLRESRFVPVLRYALLLGTRAPPPHTNRLGAQFSVLLKHDLVFKNDLV